MVGKTYLRYVVGPQGGAVVSNASLSVSSVIALPSHAPNTSTRKTDIPRGTRSRAQDGSAGSAVIFAASLEAVRVYSVRSGVLLHTLIPAEAKMPLEVTTLRVLPLDVARTSSSSLTQQLQQNCTFEQGGWMLLVGYHNGHVAVFSCNPTCNYALPVCRFYALGHRVDTTVLALAVDAGRSFMCSGGQDTDLTVWDLVAQEPSFRLRGHRGGIVGVEFIPQQRQEKAQMLVVTGAADGLIKVWDVSIRQCIQTIVASDAQLSSLRIDCAGRRLYCGMRENQLKVFNTEALTLGTPDGASEGGAMSTMVVEHGSILRKLHKPITFLSFSHDGAFLLACTSKTVEIFHILSREDVRKKVVRKRKRREGKNHNRDEENEVEEGAGRGREEARAANGVASQGADGSGANENKKTKRKMGEGSSSSSSSRKGQARGDDEEEEEDNNNNNNNGSSSTTRAGGAAATASEEVSLLRTFFFEDKVRSACFVPPTAGGGGGGGGDRLHIAVTFNNNKVHTFTTMLTTSALQGAATWTLEDLVLRHSMDHRGHHSDIRALAFVEDDTALLSLSAEKLALWNVSVKASYNGMEGVEENPNDFYDAVEANVRRDDAAGALTCAAQVAFNNAVAMAAISANICCVGLQDGTILLVDLPATEVVFSEPLVHVGGVRHVVQRPDSGGFVSIGADRRLIVWTLALLKDSSAGNQSSNSSSSNNHNNKGRVGKGDGGEETMNTSAPQLLQSTVIELTESPLFIAFSPDNRFIAVGLQNTNIQLFFGDTMKPYLSLFGHKLPPTAAAFSSDGTLIASVGMDKSLRLWGTDFGDCHRAIHAHDDYVTHVAFLQDTHQLLTVSLDGSVKHWDGDNWTMIQMFRQHQRGVWAVAVTANGTCLATAGVDKCIRCFLRTSDIVFPAEEEERMAQEAMDEEAAKRAALQNLEQQNPEVGVAGQPTTATAAAAEKLMEALDLVSVELQRRENAEDIAPPHPLLANKSPWEYLWSIIESVRPSEVRHALSSLTSTHIDALLNYLETMLQERAVLNYEIAARILLFLVAAPPTAAGGYNTCAAIAGEVSEAHGARRLAALRRMIAQGLDRTVGRMDYNIAGLQFLRQVLEDGDKTRFFDLSKIQGYKKKYHSRALPNGGDEKQHRKRGTEARKVR